MVKVTVSKQNTSLFLWIKELVLKVIKKNWKFFRLKLAFVLASVFLFSCSQTKFVPKDQYLISKVEVDIDNPKHNIDEAKSYVKDKENYKILGFLKFHLFLYNLSSKKKTNDWFKRIGEPPKIFDEALSQRSEEQLKQYAYSKGYFRANVDSRITFKKNRKADITYTITTGDFYTIRKINYEIADSALENIYFNSALKPVLATGDVFDLEELEKHRADIVDLFRNKGYYYFSGDNVKYLADTTVFEKQVILSLVIKPAVKAQTDSAKVFSPFYLDKFYYSILPSNTAVTATRDNQASYTDTIKWNNSVLYENKDFTYPPALFDRIIQMKTGDLYNNASVENTFTALNLLRQFRFVDIQFHENEAKKDSNLLDTYIRLAPLSKQGTSFDIEGTNTSGNFGVAGYITYQHRNLFRGAEVFAVNLKGATERLQHLKQGGLPDYFNTREFGVESNLTIPRLLGPGNYIKSFKRFMPRTVISLGYNYQKRPEYTRTISNLKFGYEWKSTEDLRNIWSLVDFNDVHIFEFDPVFVNSIRDLYIRSSFTDHLIFATNYSMIFNNQRVNKLKKYTYVRFNFESAGNVLSAFARTFGFNREFLKDSQGNVIDSYLKLFNTRFAQYVKTDIEFRRGLKIDEYNSFVMRAFAGVGIPYGNFDVLPFEKQYFTGGANGIRAWPVRALGPGTYKASAGDYPNMTSDIKMEANAEYRFHLTGFLEGALFLDVGNIWSISSKDNREGAQFRLNTFYKQFALGTGAGLRFDFSYFIFRFDLGMKLREPAQQLNDGWIIGNRSYSNNDFNLNFAIGYPF